MKKLIIIFLCLTSFNCFSEEFKPNFTIQDFKKAQDNGKIVVVFSWNKFCTTCARQKPILKEAEKEFKNILFFNYEQTKQKEIAKYLEINYWSTIAVYKDNKQVAKSIGIYEKDEIYSLIKQGI